MSSRPISSAKRRFSLIALLTICACSGGDTGPANGPYALNAVGPISGLTATVATTTSQAPAVSVHDGTGALVPGVTITFTTTGGSSVGSPTAVSNSSGIASAGSWTLGTTAGPYQVTASAGNSNSVQFTATGTPGAPVSIAAIPIHFTLWAGDSLAILVTGVDQYGNGMNQPPSTFVSTTPSIASVTSPEGIAHAVALGKTSITVHSGTGTAVVPVTVPVMTQSASTGASWGIAVSKNDVLYVTKPYDSQIDRYDLPSHTRTTTITVGGEPIDVTFLPDGSKAYVSDINTAHVYEITVATNTVTATMSVPGLVNRVIADPGGTKVYATVGDLLEVINTTTHVVTPLFHANSDLTGVTYHPTLPWLYVSSGSQIYEVDPAVDTVRRTLYWGNSIGAQDIAFSLDGTLLFVTNEAGETEIHDGTTLAMTTTLPSTSSAFGLEVTKDGTKIWITRPVSPGPRLMVLDEATHEILESVQLDGARRIAFDKAGTTTIITSEFNNLTFVAWP